MAAAASPPGGAATTGRSPAAPAASAGSLATSRRTSNSPRRARASSSARMPIPAILGRMGSGARTTTRRVTRRAPRRLAAAPQPLGEQVELPGPGTVDLRKDAVEPPDFLLSLSDLAVILLVAREELRDAGVNELVLGEKLSSLHLELAHARFERGGLPFELFSPALRLGEPGDQSRGVLLGARERRVQTPVTLALVAQLSLRDAVPFRAERDLRSQAVESPRESLL